MAVSVVADHCLIAGSAATIAMLKGAAGKQWVAEFGLAHLWVDAAGQVGGDLMTRNSHLPLISK